MTFRNMITNQAETVRWVPLAVILAVTSIVSAEEVPFDDPRWKFEADTAEIIEFKGREALLLENGRAWLPEVGITDGVIEFDIAFGPDRGFSGVMFRYQKAGDFENFYFRPHQSGNPDATQYTPEVQGVSGWQLYHGPEFSPPFRYRFDEWMHVEITFSGTQATVSLDGETYLIPGLKRPVEPGSVGIRSGFAPAYYSGFIYREGVPDGLPDSTPPEIDRAPLPDGIVSSWRVSEAFPASERPAIEMASSFRSGLDWMTLETEPEGLVNLAWAEGVSPDNRAVIAETTISASASGHCLLRFGYSDAARVFLDGTEIYRGHNIYRSRDYRYLGTIGLFDSLVLPVKEGANLVSFVVAENFGGWGVMASVEPLNDGLSCTPTQSTSEN